MSDKTITVELTSREAAELLYMVTAGVIMRRQEYTSLQADRTSTPLQRGAARTQLDAAASARDKLLEAAQRLEAERSCGCGSGGQRCCGRDELQ